MENLTNNHIYKQNFKDYSNSTTKSMIFSCFFQLISCVIIYAFSNLALLVTMDIAYWPPFMNFNLNNYTFWSSLLYIMLGFTFLQFIFAIIYRKWNNKPKIRIMALIIAVVQLFFVPFGIFFGITEIIEIRENLVKEKVRNIEDDKVKEKNGEEEEEEVVKEKQNMILKDELNNNDDYEKWITKNVSIITVSAGLFHEGIIFFIYLITIYFSTVQLDITYPYITMNILLQVRLFLLIFSIIYGLQIIFGAFYQKLSNNKIWKKVYFIFGIIQILVIPIGTYAGIYLIKDLNSKR